VPATGFYEWQRVGPGPKQPFLLRPAGAAAVAFAGLYETWCGPDGEEVDTAAILTRPANRALADIHDRMPAVVPPDRFAAWLDPREEDGTAVLAALPEAADDLFERVPISTRVNSAANDGPEVQEPATAAVPDRADASPARRPDGGRRRTAEEGEPRRQDDGGQLDLF
jgi:putative SOS response-associated peptidase YedK